MALSLSPGSEFTCKICSTFPKVTSETKYSTCLCWAIILALVKTLTRPLQEHCKNKETVLAHIFPRTLTCLPIIHNNHINHAYKN